MKLHLRNQNSFSKPALDFYQENFTLTDEENADVIVVNDFLEANYPDKVVARNSTGLDGLVGKEIISLRGEDLSDLTAVAELTLAMAIILCRDKGEELRGKTLLIVGYGRIGEGFREIASNFFYNILTYDKSDSEPKNLNTLLSMADVISLHITSDEENRNFFTKEMFEKMKDGAIFLNSARQWLVEEEGLKWALENKGIRVWYDFLTPFEHERLWVTPHMAGGTKQSREKSEMIIAKKIFRIKNSQDV